MVLKSRVFFILIVLFISAVFSFFVSLRDVDVGSDTAAYIDFYNNILLGINSRITEPLFVLIAKFSSFFSSKHNFNFFLISFLSLSALFSFYKRVFLLWGAGNEFYIGLSSVIFITFISPFFINTQVNVLRAGLSIPFIFFSAYFIFNKKYFNFFMSSLVAVMFHYSSILFIIPLVIFYNFRLNYLFYLFMSLFVVYLTGVLEVLIIKLSSLVGFSFMEYYLRYLTGEGSYEKGVRLDFSLLTVFFGSIAYYLYLKYKNNISGFTLFAYCSLSIPFFIIGFMNYSDRLLLPAWSLIPLILSLLLVQSIVKYKYVFYAHVILIPLAVIVSFFYYGII